MSQNEALLKRALERERAARKAAEEILEAKSAELYEVNKQLKAANAELLTSYSKTTSQLQGVFENIVDAYLIMDLWGNILKMNDAAVDLLGYNSTKDEGNLMDLIGPEELPVVQKSFKELLEKGAITDFEIKITTKDNIQKLVHINASVIYENNEPVGAQGIVRDITIQDAYRKAIEAERIKYSNIIANMNLGLVEVNNDDEIQMVNQSFTAMSGYNEDELIGKRGGRLLQVEGDEDIIKRENEKRLNGESNSYELKVKTKSGEVKYWLLSGAPNYDLKGNIIGSIGIHLDITELKNLEAQKEKLLGQLEKSNEELHEYAHIVSHDLKSPLRSINALITWLKEDNKDTLDASSLENINLIEMTLEKMEQLITDILNYSSVGSESGEDQQFDMQKMLEDLLTIMFVPENIKVTIPNNLPTLIGDKTKIQQVFQNLIGNAIKFNDKEQGLIDVTVQENPTHYQFSISDNGVGIEPKFHDKIFKIFHSLENRDDSSGIGLSIVKKIVNLHDGEIWLESAPGEGTTFYFTLKK